MIELKPCPFCGKQLCQKRRKYNPFANCVTKGCKGSQLPLLNLDMPEDVAAWNRRAEPERSLLRSPSGPLIKGCYCKPGNCAAPIITGRQMPCLDPAKAAMQESKKEVNQYYYGTNHCQAENSRSPNCVCWHDEGTGPFSHAVAPDVTSNRTSAVRLSDGISEISIGWRVKPTQKIRDTLVLRITTAYEQGYGKGQLKTSVTNPYKPETHEHEAWQTGYDEGEENGFSAPEGYELVPINVATAIKRVSEILNPQPKESTNGRFDHIRFKDESDDQIPDA